MSQWVRGGQRQQSTIAGHRRLQNKCGGGVAQARSRRSYPSNSPGSPAGASSDDFGAFHSFDELVKRLPVRGGLRLSVRTRCDTSEAMDLRRMPRRGSQAGADQHAAIHDRRESVRSHHFCPATTYILGFQPGELLLHRRMGRSGRDRDRRHSARWRTKPDPGPTGPPGAPVPSPSRHSVSRQGRLLASETWCLL